MSDTMKKQLQESLDNLMGALGALKREHKAIEDMLKIYDLALQTAEEVEHLKARVIALEEKLPSSLPAGEPTNG